MSDKPRYPLRQLFWEFTLNCNLSCRHCGSECIKATRSDDMPLEDFLPVLDDIKSHQPGVRSIVFTLGGEPLVRKDIMRCGYEITRKGFYWGFVSNGMLIDGPTMRELSRCGLASLAIDIDGLRDDHNWLRQSPVSFDRVYNAIQHIRKAPHLVWDVITCVNPRNYPHLPQIKQMLIEAGVKKWRCFSIIPVGHAADNPELILSDDQLLGLMEFIRETRREGKINLSYACEGYTGPFEPDVRSHPFMCVAGINTASVRINGDISGCLSIRNHYDQGNIYRDSFWDVWTNRFQPYRNRAWKRRDECRDCEVFDRCQGDGMHLRRDDGSLMRCTYNILNRAMQKRNQPNPQ